ALPPSDTSSSRLTVRMASRTELAKFEASSFRADRSVLMTAGYTQNVRRVHGFCEPHRGKSLFLRPRALPYVRRARPPRGTPFDAPRDRAAALPGCVPLLCRFPLRG